MNDLFRFLLLRPAEPPEPHDVKALAASYVDRGASRDLAKRGAHEFARDKAFILNPSELAYASAARAVATLLRAGPAPAGTISDTVKTEAGKTAANVLADKRFATEE